MEGGRWERGQLPSILKRPSEENSNLWGCQMTPPFQEAHEPGAERGQAALARKAQEWDHHSAKTELASPPTGSLP